MPKDAVQKLEETRLNLIKTLLDKRKQIDTQLEQLQKKAASE